MLNLQKLTSKSCGFLPLRSQFLSPTGLSSKRLTTKAQNGQRDRHLLRSARANLLHIQMETIWLQGTAAQ